MLTYPAVLDISNLVEVFIFVHTVKIVSEYDQEIPQSQTVDIPVAL